MNILWDFDGTLFDTYPSLVEAFVELSKRNLDRQEVLSWLKKDSKTAFKHYGLDENRRQEYQRLYHGHAKTSSAPFSHLEEVLSLADKNFIVTHREKDSTLYLLDKFALTNYFSEIVSVEEQGFIRKPDSSAYEYVLKKHPIDLVVGDRELDLIPARQLGIPTVAFQNQQIEADFHINSYVDFHDSVYQTIQKSVL